ncbi:jhy protein homolog isoform X2 [Echeneis naucrates]|uniref:jhy protein homolog isoform X2 n=1 Tax=Echeneis naucrates TaxID=173247 RepID=UPI00111444BC|nr:uncharacterized protein LOC115054686 isoform X2 [Echeneis naucrates]
MLTPYMAAIEPDQPYCLHLQSSTSSSGTSTPCHNQALQCRAPGTNATELQIQHQQQPTCTQGAPIQSTNSTSLTSPEVLLDKKPEGQMKDIVESNKLTLGCNRSKCGYSTRAHSLKQEMHYNINEVHETLKENATEENQEISSDPELRWFQRTQQLQHPHAQAVRPEQGDCRRSTFARPAPATKLKPQRTTTSQPLPPTIQFLSTSPHLLSLLQQRSQEAIIKLESLHGHPDGRPSSEVQLSLYPRYQQTNPGKLSHTSLEGQNVRLHHPGKRTTAAQWLLTCEGPEDQTWSLNQVPQYLPWTPTTASSQGLGSCTVLPPIRKSMTGKQLKMNPSQTVHTVSAIQGSSFDSYLLQMEKQKHRRMRITLTVGAA